MQVNMIVERGTAMKRVRTVTKARREWYTLNQIEIVPKSISKKERKESKLATNLKILCCYGGHLRSGSSSFCNNSTGNLVSSLLFLR